jgi:hypothetical protein
MDDIFMHDHEFGGIGESSRWCHSLRIGRTVEARPAGGAVKV